MTGREIAEKLWKICGERGLRVEDGTWDKCSAELKGVWEDFAQSMGKLNIEDVTREVAGWERADQQYLYELLYNIGCRIR